MIAVDPALIESASIGLGRRDAHFLQRVYADGLDKYVTRLGAIGFTGRDSVLDAGCGFGQWTLALAQSCRSVEGLDADPIRVRVAERIASQTANVRIRRGSIEALPFDDATFDAVFCYSAVYYTNVRKAIAELCRVTKPGGALYISSNGLGWYLYNIVEQPYQSEDFDPRGYGLRALFDSLRYFTLGTAPSEAGSVITSRRWLSRVLRKSGADRVVFGPEGTIAVDGSAPVSFFRGAYLGCEGVSEWLAHKRA